MKKEALKDKKILIGITGGAAIYKTCNLVRIFKKEKAKLKIVMTETAKRLISPFLFQSLSSSPVFTSIFDFSQENKILHIYLAEWADIFLISPATLNTISKLTNGIADNLLGCVFFALPKETPVVIVPAMNENMWENIFFQKNLRELKKRKNLEIVLPQKGTLASGKIGRGKIAEEKDILETVIKFLCKKKS